MEHLIFPKVSYVKHIDCKNIYFITKHIIWLLELLMIMIVTNADKNGNTLAWQRYQEGFKRFGFFNVSDLTSKNYFFQSLILN